MLVSSGCSGAARIISPGQPVFASPLCSSIVSLSVGFAAPVRQGHDALLAAAATCAGGSAEGAAASAGGTE